VKSLHSPVLHRGDTQRTHFAARFRDVDTPKGLRLIASSLQLLYRLSFLLRGVPDFSVHSRCLLARVSRHSVNGNNLAAIGVSQQSLQDFYLAPSAYFRRLHDTRLEPTHISLRGLPIDGSPTKRFARSRTNSFRCRHLLCLVSRLLKFSRVKDQKEVCLLSQPGHVADLSDSAGIRSITERPSLSPSSVARTSIGPPYGGLSPKGEIRVYPVPLERHSRLGPLYTPTVLDCP
jgi:hypothetical protein